MFYQKINFRVLSQLFFPSLFIGTTLVFFQVDKFPFELLELKQLVMSEATSYGVDVSKRVSFFYNTIYLLFTYLVLTLFLLYKIVLPLGIQETSLKTWNLLAVLGLINVLTAVIGLNNNILIYFLLWILISKILLDLLYFKFKRIRWLRNNYIFTIIASSAFNLYFLTVFLFGLKNEEQFFAFFFSYFILIILSLSVLKRKGNISLKKQIVYLAPIAFIPYLIFISIELQFIYFNIQGNLFGYKKMFAILFCIILILLGLTYKKIKLKRNNVTKQFKKIWLFSIIFMISLSFFYTPFYTESGELFELANPANSMMRIFQFNQIPLLDFFSSHMLSEQWYGIIYNLFHGYTNSLAFLIYDFFNYILFTILVYLFIKKIFKSALLSFIFVISFQFLDALFFPPVFTGIVIFLYLERQQKKHSVKYYLGLFSIFFGLILWRLDTAVSGILSGIIYIILLFFIDNYKVQLNKFLKASIVYLSIFSLLFIIAIAFRGKDFIFTNIELILDYISGNQTHGRFSLTYGHQFHQFELYHVVFPFIAFISVIYLLFVLTKEKNQNSFEIHYKQLLKASLFLFLLFFINFQRGLVRHGFPETNEVFLVSLFFIALSFLLVYLFKVTNKTNQFILFCSVSFLLFISTKHFSINKGDTLFQKSISNNVFIDLNKSFNPALFKSNRVITNSQYGSYKPLKKYFDKNIVSSNSFIDFSNSPLLYYYTHRNIYGYFNQNIQNLVGEDAQHQYIQTIAENNPPFTVFSSYPKSFFDNLDDIPNEIRYHLVSEYIYQNYEPYGIICDKSIWKLKGYAAQPIEKKDTNAIQPRSYHYKKTAYFFGCYFNQQNIQLLKIDLSDDKNFILKCDSRKYPNSFLKIDLENESNLSQVIWVELKDVDNNILGTFSFETTEKKQDDYYLRLSNHYLWHIKKVKSIHVIVPPLIKVKHQQILKDNRFENKKSNSNR